MQCPLLSKLAFIALTVEFDFCTSFTRYADVVFEIVFSGQAIIFRSGSHSSGYIRNEAVTTAITIGPSSMGEVSRNVLLGKERSMSSAA